MADHGLRRIQGLEQLIGLRKACFAHHEISHIQGLEACTALQELSFEVCESPQLYCSGSDTLCCRCYNYCSCTVLHSAAFIMTSCFVACPVDNDSH
jgi:hypothetical protein